MTAPGFLPPAALAHLDAIIKGAPPPIALAPVPQPAVGPAAEDWCELRVEVAPGNLWRVRWRTADGDEKASEWRPRERYYSQLSVFLGFLRNFVFKGLGRIPLSLNPPRPRED